MMPIGRTSAASVPGRLRGLGYLLLIVTLTLWLDACQTPSPEATISSQNPGGVRPTMPLDSQTTITFACSGYEQAQYQQLAEEFHTRNPAIAVQIIPSTATSGNAQDDLRDLAASADSFLLKRPLQPQDIQSGLLRDLQPFVEADAAFAPEDFYPGLLDRFRWQGKLWGLPSPGTPLVLFYDKAAFDEAGLPYPQPGWSFDEFETAARAMTRRQGAGTTRYGLVISPHSLAGPVLVLGRAEGWAEGTRVLSKPILDAPAVVEAAQWFVDLAREPGVMPNPYDLADGATPFVVREVEEGRAAMWDGWPTAYLRAAYGTVHDLGIAPFPEGTLVSDWVGGGVYAMSAGTAHPDEVWQWLRFLTYQAGDVPEVRPPVRRSVAEGSGYWAKLGADLAPVVRYIMERPKVALPPGMVETLDTSLRKTLVGDLDVNDALIQGQKELAEALGMPVAKIAPPPVSTPTQGAVEASITYCPVSYDTRIYEKLSAAFHETHPEIAVSLTGGMDTFEKAARSCDCFNWWLSEEILHPEQRKLILSLQPLAEADPTLPDDFYDGLLEASRREGDLWALPAYVDLIEIRYNKRIFDQAGIAYPQPGWTLDDFYQKVTALASTEAEDKIYGYLSGFSRGEWLDVDFFVEQYGGFGMLSSEEARPRFAPLKPAETLAAMDRYTSLILEHDAIPYSASAYKLSHSDDWSQRRDLIAAGSVAMWTAQMTWASPSGFAIGAAPLPLGQGRFGQYSIVAYMISADTTSPDACWTWIKFLLDQPAAIAEAPARRSLLDNVEFSGGMEEERFNTIQFSLEHLDPVGWRINPALHQAFDAIMGGIPVTAAVEEAVRKDEILQSCLAAVSGLLEEGDITACLEKAGLTSP